MFPFLMNKIYIKNLRCFSTSLVRNLQIDNLLIIGSGLMGSGIAQSCAQALKKFDSIVLQDVNQKSLENAKKKIISNLTILKKKNTNINIDEIVSKIHFTQKIQPLSTNNLLIIEAIPEILELKQKLFKELDSNFGNEHVILTTNTSSLSCKEIGIYIKNKTNYAGLHFFNPVPLMKLVEIIKLDETSNKIFQCLIEFVKNINKISVNCKDTPGFIVNRLLIPYILEAIKLVERGDATNKDVDIAMKLGAGYPMGPFELIDYVGIDTVKFIMDGWIASGNDFIENNNTINKLYNCGKFGKKSGSGFYDYTKK